MTKGNDEMAKRINPDEYIGKKYGRLTVVEYVGRDKRSQIIVRCICDCGEERTVFLHALKKGNTSSCGCFNREQAAARLRIHGDSAKKERLYRIWAYMKQRCYRENDINYTNYGGRGIGVCDEWRNDYTAFRDWALNNGYDDSLSIDRIDVNGDYEPNNCRWATAKEQARNRRSNRYITYNGETMLLVEWAERFGLPPKILTTRLYLGWSMEKALTTPVKKRTSSSA